MGIEQYRSLFVAESEEHLQIVNNALLKLEKAPDNLNILNEIFRSAHTLKGMSATMGFKALTKLTHKMEDVLDVFRAQKIPVTTEVIDALFRCLDMLQMLLEEVKTEKDLSVDVDAMIVQLEGILPTISSAAAATFADKKNEIRLTPLERDNLREVLSAQDLYIYIVDIFLSPDCQLKSARAFMVFSRLGDKGEVIKSDPPVDELEKNHFGCSFELLFLTHLEWNKAEELLAKIIEIDKIEIRKIENINDIPDEKGIKVKARTETAAAADEEAGKRKEGMAPQTAFKKIQSIRVSTKRLDNLMNYVGELVIAKIRLMQIARVHQIQSLHEILTNIDRLMTDLQDEVMQVRLIPIAQVFDRFPRMVRDLARSEYKQINLELSGGEIELDRTVLDEIADPLVHLLRNAVDHGIELPQERKSNNKSPVGVIKLTARREKIYVLIEVSDDGRGMDPNMLRQSAVSKGFITEDEANKLSNKEILELILLPGFSSSVTITDTSGRGVGMDVVKMKIEDIGGTVSFDSVQGKGSIFSLKLPVTVAIIRAMLVKVAQEIYAIPIANVAETVKIPQHKIKHIEKSEVVNLRNEVVSLLRMDKFLGALRATTGEKKEEAAEGKEIEYNVVIVESGGRKAGLVVEDVLGQQEVVIKSIGALLKGIRGFSGATILGDGRVALILDVAAFLMSK
ncbi:MAG: chemotaxis protein CheA [Candidatus Omnitrophica bacterium]|nr:chemotaxis protein CheA [Candidatus Omnitrophota bacterium]